MGTVWNVINHYNPAWKPGPREVVEVSSVAVGFKSLTGTSYLRFDQVGEKFSMNDEGTLIEIRDEDGNLALSYSKVIYRIFSSIDSKTLRVALATVT